MNTVERAINIETDTRTEQNLLPCVAKYHLPGCVPSDAVSQIAAVSVCPLCCTLFGY